MYRVESHRSRVGTHLLFHHRHAHALAPDVELLHGSCAESVGSTEHHLVAGFFEQVGKFADCSGLTHTIHAHHHYHVGAFVGRNSEIGANVGIVFGEQVSYFFAKQGV